MNRFYNDRHQLVEEMIEGYLLAYGNTFQRVNDRNGLIMRQQEKRVSIVTGGGSGGEPWCLGMVGRGLADGVAIGHIFAAPSAITVAAVCRAVYHDKGVLLITGNHTGDKLNFELGAELLALDDNIDCHCIYVTDDLGSNPNKDERSGATGIGIVLMYAAAAARRGLTLEQTSQIARLTNQNLSTISMALSLGSNPATGVSMGDITMGEIHFGYGVTGEPALCARQHTTADDATDFALELLTKDLSLQVGDEVALFINGGGSTTVLEEIIVCRRACQYLQQHGIRVRDVDLSERLRVEMTHSISISLLKLDETLDEYVDIEASSPLLSKRHF